MAVTRRNTQRIGRGTDAAARPLGHHRRMHLTISQLLVVASSGGAAWLMLRAGAAKRLLSVKAPNRCASCGRRRGRGLCECAR